MKDLIELLAVGLLLLYIGIVLTNARIDKLKKKNNLQE